MLLAERPWVMDFAVEVGGVAEMFASMISQSFEISQKPQLIDAILPRSIQFEN